MRSEGELKQRITYWENLREGILYGEGTKKTIKHLIEELEWVLENDNNGQLNDDTPDPKIRIPVNLSL